MSTVTTARAVNPSQLGVELGRRGLHTVGPDADGNTTVTVPGVGTANLTNALDAHVADPNWTDPNPPSPPAPTRREELRTRAKDRKLTDAEALEAVRLALADGRL